MNLNFGWASPKDKRTSFTYRCSKTDQKLSSLSKLAKKINKQTDKPDTGHPAASLRATPHHEVQCILFGEDQVVSCLGLVFFHSTLRPRSGCIFISAGSLSFRSGSRNWNKTKRFFAGPEWKRKQKREDEQKALIMCYSHCVESTLWRHGGHSVVHRRWSSAFNPERFVIVESGDALA